MAYLDDRRIIERKITVPNRQERRKKEREEAKAAKKAIMQQGFVPLAVQTESYPGQIQTGVLVKKHIQEMLEAGGIQTKDLDEAYNKGLREGYRNLNLDMVRASYAACCLALNELYGFGTKRCNQVLELMHKKINLMIDSNELADEVWRRMQLEIELKDNGEVVV